MSRRKVVIDVPAERHPPYAQPPARPPSLQGDQLAVALKDALALKKLKPAAPKPTKKDTSS